MRHTWSGYRPRLKVSIFNPPRAPLDPSLHYDPSVSLVWLGQSAVLSFIRRVRERSGWPDSMTIHLLRSRHYRVTWKILKFFTPVKGKTNKENGEFSCWFGRLLRRTRMSPWREFVSLEFRTLPLMAPKFEWSFIQLRDAGRSLPCPFWTQTQTRTGDSFGVENTNSKHVENTNFPPSTL